MNALDKERHSPVHWAVVCGQLEALDVLCNSGSLINTADIHGAFPLHYAAQMCGPAEDQASDKARVFLVVLRKLLARPFGASLGGAEQTGRTAGPLSSSPTGVAL